MFKSLVIGATNDRRMERVDEIFGGKMKFDVIIGNPPYQLNDGGGTGSSAVPIYQNFVEQAKRLEPRFMSFVIPSRWFSGGRGLDEFRDTMLKDTQLRIMHDFADSELCFSGVKIEGGVNYFLWEKDNHGTCQVHSHQQDGSVSIKDRSLLESGLSTFIRYNEAVDILHKVISTEEEKFSEIVSSNDPFGFDVREEGSYRRIKPNYKLRPFANSAQLYYFGWNSNGIGYVDRNSIRKGHSLIDQYKVYISKAYGMGNKLPAMVIGAPFIGEPGSCCTETYLLVGPTSSRSESINIISYMRTKFFRFLVMQIKNTQNAMQKVYSFVPMQDFSKGWTDQELYMKYGLDQDEIDFIESMIRPMEVEGE